MAVSQELNRQPRESSVFIDTGLPLELPPWPASLRGQVRTRIVTGLVRRAAPDRPIRVRHPIVCGRGVVRWVRGAATGERADDKAAGEVEHGLHPRRSISDRIYWFIRRGQHVVWPQIALPMPFFRPWLPFSADARNRQT